MTERPPRASYAEAGRAMREVIERALAANLTKREWRVLAAVLSLTASYSRLEERTTVGQIADLTGLARRHVSSALNALRRKGVLDWRPSRNRYRTASVVSLAGRQIGPNEGRLYDDRQDRNRSTDRTDLVPQTGPVGGSPYEKTSEKTSEGEQLDWSPRVSASDRRRLYKAAKDLGLGEAELREVIKAVTGETSTSNLTVEQLDAVVAALGEREAA